VPYYNKPNQRGIVRHFHEVCERSRFPVVLYNVPGRTVVGMSVDAMVDACAHPNVCGLKEASGDLHAAAKLFGRVREGVALLSGDDATAMAFVALGGAGVISVVSNVAPRLMSELMASTLAGDLATARGLNGRVAHVHDLMFSYASPLPAKAVCAKLGFGDGTVRLPLDELSADERDQVLATALRLGLVG
jgi:4-hydroxy-tetrahydrodipicolinate synthase